MPVRQSTENRFLDKVLLVGRCWEWQARRGKNGYGRFWNGKLLVGAHRAAYVIFCGPIPDGLWVLHECDNKPCVNPAHLFLGTHLDNMADMVSKGRGRRILTASDVESLRTRIRSGETNAAEAAEEYGVAKTTIMTWCKTGNKGVINGPAKLTNEKVMEIRRLLAAGKTRESVARMFGVVRNTIAGIEKGKHWKHLL